MDGLLSPEAPQTLATDIYGPTFVGEAFQILVFGASLPFAAQYLMMGGSASGRERHWMRWFIALVMIMNAGHTVVCFLELVTSAIKQHRTLEEIALGSLYRCLTSIFGSVAGFSVQAFLARQIYFFATPGWPRWSVLGILATTWILGFGAWIAVLYYTFQTWKGQLALALFNTWEPMYLITAAIFDVTYAVAFAFQLRRRIQHFNKDTDAHLRKLMRISLGAAAVTTVSAIVGASLATVYRGTELDVVFTPFVMPIPGYYVLTLFLTLFARRGFGGNAQSTPKPVVVSPFGSAPLHSVKSEGNITNSRSQQSANDHQVAIHIQRQTEMEAIELDAFRKNQPSPWVTRGGPASYQEEA